MSTPSEIQAVFQKLASYCAYQERSKQEVWVKLEGMGLDESEKQAVVEALEEDNFLNEKRFAEVFAGSKFRQKKWGKNKIKQALLQKGINGELLHQALNSIDMEDYWAMLEALMEQKWNSLPDDLTYLQKKNKTMQYLLQKGYESGMIYEVFPSS